MAVFEFNSLAKASIPSTAIGVDETGVLDWVDPDGKPRYTEIVIKQRGPRGLVASAKSAPPRNQMMRLREPAANYYVIVQAVGGTPGEHSLDLIYSYAGRRREQRQQVSGPAEVTWATRGKVAITRCDATVSDVSPDGLRLTTAEALPVGVEIKVNGATLECVGRTVYCEKTGSHYQSGVQFSRDPREPL